jgi:hypothetical protein
MFKAVMIALLVNGYMVGVVNDEPFETPKDCKAFIENKSNVAGALQFLTLKHGGVRKHHVMCVPPEAIEQLQHMMQRHNQAKAKELDS